MNVDATSLTFIIERRHGLERRSADHADGPLVPTRRHGIQRRHILGPANPPVVPPPPSSLTNFTLSAPPPSITVGDPDWLPTVASETWSGTPGTTTYTYATGNAAVFTIVAGKVHAIGAGSAQLIATAAAPYNLVRTTFINVTVVVTPVPTYLDFGAQFNNGVSVTLPSSTRLVPVTVFDQNNNIVVGLDASVTWDTSDHAQATSTAGPIASTTVTPVAVGAGVTLTATLTGGFGTITKTVAITVNAAPVYTAWYKHDITSADFLVAVPTGVLPDAPSLFVNQTMLADQSGAGATYSITPTNPGGQLTTPWNPAWANLVTTSQQPNAYRTPIVQVQADAPNGYAMRTHVDITPAGTDIQRKQTIVMAASHLTAADPELHCRLKYRFGAGANLANFTPTNMKFMRFKTSGTVSFYLFSPFLGSSPRWSFASDNFTYGNPGTLFLNNQPGVTPPTATSKPRGSNSYLSVEVGLTLLDSTHLRYQMWDEGVLCTDVVITLAAPFTAGVKIIDIFDTLNTPPTMFDYYWLTPVISNGYIGL